METTSYATSTRSIASPPFFGQKSQFMHHQPMKLQSGFRFSPLLFSPIMCRHSAFLFLLPSIFSTFLCLFPPQISARSDHVIDFRSPNLYPEGLAWDPSGQHFLVGSLHDRTISSVSDASVVQTLISDSSLPENVAILGLTVDSVNKRLLAVIHGLSPLSPFNALAAYDLSSRNRIFLSRLPPGDSGSELGDVANDVAVDFKGNAYVTNSGNNFIWKVNKEGEPSIFSRSKLYTANPVLPDAEYSTSGLNGIVYVSKGYLLVVQSNTGKMFKVDADDGTARLVLLNKDLEGADDIAMRKNDVVLVVTLKKVWFLKSHDSWGEGVVYDEIALDEGRSPTAVVVGAQDRAYVLYGHVLEGIKVKGAERERFGIVEVRSPKESGEESVWIYVLVGLGLVYFLVWRFQMKRLVNNLNKKTH